MKKTITRFLVITSMISFGLYACNDDDTPPTDDGNDNVSICDTMNVVYDGDIETIITNSCANGYCHGGVQLPKLDNYDSVVNAVNNYGLMTAISHEAGRVPMPKGGAKLSDDIIQRIKCWTEKSMPKN